MTEQVAAEVPVASDAAVNGRLTEHRGGLFKMTPDCNFSALTGHAKAPASA
jgi:hypothetical protein